MALTSLLLFTFTSCAAAFSPCAAPSSRASKRPCQSAALSSARSGTDALLEPRTLRRLFAFGAVGGPIVDAVHNQAILGYDVQPVELSLFVFNARTSLLIPPLLGFAYCVLGAVLPSLWTSPEMLHARQYDARGRALLAVGSTVLIIKASDVLERATAGGDAHGLALALLAAMALAQWAWLDATVPALCLALVVRASSSRARRSWMMRHTHKAEPAAPARAQASVGGPLAELPFLSLGAWHYLAPDYFPLEGGPGLASCTSACYFAVTTDAIALGRWFASPSSPSPAPGAGDGPGTGA